MTVLARIQSFLQQHATLLTTLAFGATLLWILSRRPRSRPEPFADMPGPAGISLQQISTQALDSAPTTSEAKQHYKTLLVFAAADVQRQGTDGLRLLADFRNRLFGPRDFRTDLRAENFLANWPDWAVPLDTTIQEPTPPAADAVNAEARLLAYLQKNFPIEDQVDAQTGSVIRGIIQDFGERFVFAPGETVQLRDDFLRVPLLRGWVNPIQAGTGR
jgi:hypothetical protein